MIVRLVQYTQVSKYNIAHKLKKSSADVNKFRIGLLKSLVSFMIKVLKKPEIEGTYLNIIKNIYDKSVTSIAHSGKQRTWSLKSRMK